MSTVFTAEESPNVTRRRDAAGRVNDRPRDNFMMFYHPDEWGIDYRGKLFPQISHMSKGVGCGAVDPQTGDFTAAQAEYQQRGFVPIPHDVLGEDWDYVVAYRNRKGQRVCRTAFQTPHQSSPSSPTMWEHDQEAADAFIEALRAMKIIKPPRPEVLRNMLSQQQTLLATKKTPRTDDGAAMERYNARIARIQTAIKTLEKEIVDAIAYYGETPSPARDVVRSKLRDLLAQRAEIDDDGNAATVKARTRRRKAAPPPDEITADGGDFVADDDGEA